MIATRAAWMVAGVAAALVPAAAMWGFTVDDALISVRYARHVAEGVGWRFNTGGPATDGVTPLPWPLVLAPLARGGALAVLLRARLLGVVAWATAGGALGAGAARTPGTPAWARASALAVLALSVPQAAHASSGMETAPATLLATLAVLACARPRRAALLAGLAAALRPELAAWAVVLAVGLSAGRGRLRTGLEAAALALGPFAACALVRAAAWGRAAPLSLLAKPSDLSHGVAYAGAAGVVGLTPVLVLAPRALLRSRPALAIVAAALTHAGAMAAVGGDWMPMARLAVPVAPSLAWAAILAGEHANRAATALRSGAALVLGAGLIALGGSAVADARRVASDRAALVALATPVLSRARRVAAADVGWVGAATEADVVDLAGVTDPEAAALPGGHTSKRVDAGFLLSREPDVLLLYLANGPPLASWRDAPYSRGVEARLAGDDEVARHFASAAWWPLGTKGAGYVVLEAAP